MENLIIFILQNWDTIGLVLTNIIALFIKPPFRKLGPEIEE
jgi:hypothetical protein